MGNKTGPLDYVRARRETQRKHRWSSTNSSTYQNDRKLRSLVQSAQKKNRSFHIQGSNGTLEKERTVGWIGRRIRDLIWEDNEDSEKKKKKRRSMRTLENSTDYDQFIHHQIYIYIWCMTAKSFRVWIGWRIMPRVLNSIVRWIRLLCLLETKVMRLQDRSLFPRKKDSSLQLIGDSILLKFLPNQAIMWVRCFNCIFGRLMIKNWKMNWSFDFEYSSQTIFWYGSVFAQRSNLWLF